MSNKPDKVLRHPAIVRATHWLVALSGIALLFSGFGELPMYKRYNVVKLPGLSWAGDFELNLVIHYVASIVFLAAVVFHVVYHLSRKQLAAVPRRGDLKESVHIVKAMLTGGKEPPHGKFLAEQRVAYGAFAVVIALLVVTGLVKTYKNLGDVIVPPDLLQAITLIHTMGAMVFLMLLFAHLAAFALRANWPLLPSMVTGYVRREYALHRHPRWLIAKRDGESVSDDAGTEQPMSASGHRRAPARRRVVTTTDVLRLVPGVMVLASVSLAATVSMWWLALAGFVGVNLLQSSVSRWCLLERILIKLGVPTTESPDAG